MNNGHDNGGEEKLENKWSAGAKESKRTKPSFKFRAYENTYAPLRLWALNLAKCSKASP
jgi:hypothetical protein